MPPREKLTPAVAAQIVASIRLGATLRVAAASARISKSALSDWLKRGEDDADGKYRELFLDVEHARAERMLEALAVVQSRGRQWVAAAWFLERHDPGHYGRRTVPDPEATTTINTNVRVFLPHNGRDPVTSDPSGLVTITPPRALPRGNPDPEDAA